MTLRVEFLGTAGAMPIPRPLCACRICTEARNKGLPYTRSSPSLFVHGPDVLIDTPGEVIDQLNRSAVNRIIACFYSHWHPDHTMGRHVFSTINADYRVWPKEPRGAIDVYLPQQVAADARDHLARWDHLKYLEERERVIRLHVLPDADELRIGDTTIRPLRLAQDFVYGFLFEKPQRPLLVVADEIDGRIPPPEARGVDLAVVPMGIAEFHPLTGERLIPEEHSVLKIEATFEETLEIVAAIDAKRVVMTHIEESDGLSYDDLLEVEQRVRERGINLSFAFDTLTVEV
jgi:phosphoribosyl 1,2-cyclic phosphate phosphodiesterase